MEEERRIECYTLTMGMSFSLHPTSKIDARGLLVFAESVGSVIYVDCHVYDPRSSSCDKGESKDE